jgi:DNA-binding response OmpR family regulator
MMNSAAPTILIVEDDLTFLNALASELRAAGWEVALASSVTEACNLLEDVPISLVLLDWNLSQGISQGGPATGAVVLRESRRLNPLVPVVVMSGERAFDVRTDAVLNEADSYLEKPFSMSLVVGHVSRWLKRCEDVQKATPSTTPLSPDAARGGTGLDLSSLLDN